MHFRGANEPCPTIKSSGKVPKRWMNRIAIVRPQLIANKFPKQCKRRLTLTDDIRLIDMNKPIIVPSLKFSTNSTIWSIMLIKIQINYSLYFAREGYHTYTLQAMLVQQKKIDKFISQE